MNEKVEKLADGTLLLDDPPPVPEVWDVLVIGGGPAGTAAAFRAREQGLSALVIDYDDLMKRIRDYSKEKLILPTFGGGDRMGFPDGGEPISSLQFDPIDKDDMCSNWKALYRRFNIPAKLGIELLELELNADQVWEAVVWNHNSECQERLVAQHAVLAIGRGVPRRFDIPGKVEGIARLLSDAGDYALGPVCVIGGGTAAAEAVIAISNAKKKCGDEASVYWSYRGEQMPKVSKALSDVFFDAYVGNGNIRYLPHSEPVAVETDSADNDFLAIRTDRKLVPGRPIETVHLEFPTSACLACIGEDLPEPLLNRVGVSRVRGGPNNRKRFLVSPLMETSRPNLYLIGDLLSPGYLETEDFDADPATFQEIVRRGNIKSALRDGVWVVDVIAKKLAGETPVQAQVGGVPGRSDEGPAQPRFPVADVAPTARLVRVLDRETTAEEFILSPNAVTTVGSRGSDICFPQDSELAPIHASFRCQGEDYLVADESGSGVFIRPREGRSVDVSIGAILNAGRQWLVFEGSPECPELIHYDYEGIESRRIRLSPGTIVLGREATVTLDRSDSTLSRRHLSVTWTSERLRFSDLKSTNGTLLKVTDATLVGDGDRILIGRQEFQFVRSLKATIHRRAAIRVSRPEKLSSHSNFPATVTFQKSGACLPLSKGQTICELAEEQGMAIRAQCYQGICGSDPIRIVSGHENLNPRREAESETLEDLCSLEGDDYRLACLTRAQGPVVVEILDQEEE